MCSKRYLHEKSVLQNNAAQTARQLLSDRFYLYQVTFWKASDLRKRISIIARVDRFYSLQQIILSWRTAVAQLVLTIVFYSTKFINSILVSLR